MNQEKINALIEQRVAAYNEAQGIATNAAKENRAMTADEQKKADEILGKIAGMTAEIRTLERLDASEAELKTAEARVVPPSKTGDGQRTGVTVIELRSQGFARKITVPTQDEGELRAWCRYLRSGQMGSLEARAFQKGSDAEGGFLSAPMRFNAQLIQGLDNQVFMRGLATILPPIGAAESVGTPTLDTDAEDATWTTELGTGDEEDTLRFGLRELRPHPIAKRLKLSKTLIRRSDMDVESIIRGRLEYKVGTTLENVYLNGTGNNQPLGVMTASDQGIPTSRDISAGNAATQVKYDGLIGAKMALKPQYRSKATWIFHTDVLTQLMKLKDGEGRYIWQPSVVAGQPDTLLSRPVLESQYMPYALTTQTYNGIIGDFSQYWIQDALTMQIQVLTELYAVTNQNGYILRLETDGMPVLAEAFARVKTA